MNDPAWKKQYRVRAGVEGTLSQGVRAFGMRQSRYVGFAKTALQQLASMLHGSLGGWNKGPVPEHASLPLLDWHHGHPEFADGILRISVPGKAGCIWLWWLTFMPARSLVGR
jgi:hypothetical protein